MAAFMDITGQRFHRLVAVRRVGSEGTKALWLWQCDCGNTIERTANRVKTRTTSCGCARASLGGQSSSRLYRIWKHMKARCLRPSCHCYSLYGGRGIAVCDEWLGFPPFAEWAKANGYAEHLQIDRIDNDGNYEPSNCRWVTPKVNSQNRRNTTFVVVDGAAVPLARIITDKRERDRIRFRMNSGADFQEAVGSSVSISAQGSK